MFHFRFTARECFLKYTYCSNEYCRNISNACYIHLNVHTLVYNSYKCLLGASQPYSCSSVSIHQGDVMWCKLYLFRGTVCRPVLYSVQQTFYSSAEGRFVMPTCVQGLKSRAKNRLLEWKHKLRLSSEFHYLQYCHRDVILQSRQGEERPLVLRFQLLGMFNSLKMLKPL